jgi:hypothetical protein
VHSEERNAGGMRMPSFPETLSLMNFINLADKMFRHLLPGYSCARLTA